MSKKAISYNKIQARKFDWTPEWFDHDEFDEELIEKIKAFQKAEGLSADGLCGPSTYRRLWTERESSGDYNEELVIPDGQKYIVHNGNPVPIQWDKVLLWNEPGGLDSRKGAYRSHAGKADRNPSFFVTHWDVCLSSKSCAKVLKKRGLSVHYCIDNDGTIYQLLDSQHTGYHAGGTLNPKCVGVEISDAYSLKYQRWYERNGFGPRPIWRDKGVHGKTLKPFLGFYDVQIQALAALWEAVSRACDIPLAIPDGPDAVNTEVRRGNFEGFCCHYHLTRGKIDCAGLNMDDVLALAKELRENFEES